MLKLSTQDITLNQVHENKQSAIEFLAGQLANKGLVEESYLSGMQAREAQNSTYLGNGIAIPHGTTDTRNLVKQTGVTIAHFPHGVDWGDGNTVYLAIGIAAKSDEHLGILKQLTKVLGDEGVELALKQAQNADQIIALLNGETQFNIDFDASHIQLDFPASDMIQMAAVAAGLLKNSGSVGTEFVADIVAKSPTHLGDGVWLVSSNKGVNKTGMAFVSTANHCSYNDQSVHALLAFSGCNGAHRQQLETITELVAQNKIDSLLDKSAIELIELFSNRPKPLEEPLSSGNTAVFKIRNAHGLHARPGAMLVACAKKFESTISVRNLESESPSVNAKSLMKVIGLGVKHGHQLEFSANGRDAEEALAAIGKAIESGLGEA
ncbi:fused PTS fructose transporter subunit IIA/HPr protein [Vibrio panuliri]|uniref:Bifunctional PTS fructose transporter subunit IIA/HPr protein n=1 Tax=Vibrio panuliri TaxID=1381081 RepID=A0ABX3FJ22_9VIBR|nr:fused PTS fructose transporter subunit IIA/HPr protein [Vibrio panuliri]KAB1457437.1 fused PTS fructose transporter subunit IIA/HPr protein [Vibrio panuliri]OLQ91402.1 bifunctional PTS fructose transporter subunit IIA/HPr protein [Vibrio panuliri]